MLPVYPSEPLHQTTPTIRWLSTTALEYRVLYESKYGPVKTEADAVRMAVQFIKDAHAFNIGEKQ